MVRETFGSRGPWTTPWMFAGELGVDGRTYREWEKKGRFPGVDKLAALYASNASVRARGADPVLLAKWVETGPDDAPPFSFLVNKTVVDLTSMLEDLRPLLTPDDAGVPATDEAVTAPRVLEGGASVAARSSRVTRLANALAAIALSEAARAIVASLLRSAKAGDLASVAKLVASIKPLAESEAARVLVARLEKEVQSPDAGGVVVGESFSHLLQQHDEGHPLSVA